MSLKKGLIWMMPSTETPEKEECPFLVPSLSFLDIITDAGHHNHCDREAPVNGPFSDHISYNPLVILAK